MSTRTTKTLIVFPLLLIAAWFPLMTHVERIAKPTYLRDSDSLVTEVRIDAPAPADGRPVSDIDSAKRLFVAFVSERNRDFRLASAADTANWHEIRLMNARATPPSLNQGASTGVRTQVLDMEQWLDSLPIFQGSVRVTFANGALRSIAGTILPRHTLTGARAEITEWPRPPAEARRVAENRCARARPGYLGRTRYVASLDLRRKRIVYPVRCAEWLLIYDAVTLSPIDSVRLLVSGGRPTARAGAPAKPSLTP